MKILTRCQECDILIRVSEGYLPLCMSCSDRIAGIKGKEGYVAQKAQHDKFKRLGYKKVTV